MMINLSAMVISSFFTNYIFFIMSLSLILSGKMHWESDQAISGPVILNYKPGGRVGNGLNSFCDACANIVAFHAISQRYE